MELTSVVAKKIESRGASVAVVTKVFLLSVCVFIAIFMYLYHVVSYTIQFSPPLSYKTHRVRMRVTNASSALFQT